VVCVLSYNLDRDQVARLRKRSILVFREFAPSIIESARAAFVAPRAAGRRNSRKQHNDALLVRFFQQTSLRQEK